jgi:hypothetical protein
LLPARPGVNGAGLKVEPPSAWMPDVLTFGEPRLAGYVAHFYGTGAAPASQEELARAA